MWQSSFFLMGWIVVASGSANGSLVNPGFETDGEWGYTLTSDYVSVSRLFLPRMKENTVFLLGRQSVG